MIEKEVLNYKDKFFLTDNLDDYATSFNDSRDEYINYYKFENGGECAVYYPPNIDENTKIVTYYPGIGNKNDWSYRGSGGHYGIQDYLCEDGSNQIVIMPMDNTGQIRYREVIGAKVAINIQEKYNLKSDCVTWAGWSNGGPYCLESPAVYQALKPDSGPQVVMAVDGFNSFSSAAPYEVNLLQDNFKKNNNILISLQEQHRPHGHDFLDTYAKAGFNVVRAIYVGDCSMDCYTPNGRDSYAKQGHTAVNQSFVKDGFMELSADGSSTLPTEGYIYSVWDDVSGGWVDIDVNEINTYEKLMSFFGNKVSGNNSGMDDFSLLKSRLTKLKGLEDIVVKSDDASLQNGLNSVRHCVKNSACVQEGVPSMSCSSTTAVPSKISSVVANYMSTTTSLLELVANQTDTFVSIYNSINNIDQDIEKDSNELEDEKIINLVDTKNIEEDKSNLNITNLDNDTNLAGNPNNKDSVDKVTDIETDLPDKDNNPDIENKQLDNENLSNGNDFSGTEEELGADTDVSSSEKPNGNSYVPMGNSGGNQPQSRVPSGGNPGGNQPQPHVPSSGGSGGNDIEKNEFPFVDSQNEIQGNNDSNSILFPFENFDDLTSDGNQLVYNFSDDCRIVVHNNGGKLTGLEHYYKISDINDTNKIYDILKSKYNPSIIDDIEINGDCIRVKFKNSAINLFGLERIKNKYNGLNII